MQKYDHDKQTMNNQCKNKLPCRKLNVQKKQLKTCFTQIYRVKEGDEIYNYLPCPSFDDLLSFRLMHKRREVNDDQHSPVPFCSLFLKTYIKRPSLQNQVQ